MPYKSSLSDEEWKIVEPLLSEILPPKKRTRPANWSKGKSWMASEINN